MNTFRPLKNEKKSEVDWRLPEVYYVSSETERQKPFFYRDRDAIKVLQKRNLSGLSTCRVNVHFQKIGAECSVTLTGTRSS